MKIENENKLVCICKKSADTNSTEVLRISLKKARNDFRVNEPDSSWKFTSKSNYKKYLNNKVGKCTEHRPSFRVKGNVNRKVGIKGSKHQIIIPTVKIKKDDYQPSMNIISTSNKHYIVQAYTVASEDIEVRSHTAKKFIYDDKDPSGNNTYTFAKCGQWEKGKIIRTIKKGEFIRNINSTSINHRYNTTQDNMLGKLETRKVPRPTAMEHTLAKMRNRFRKDKI